MKYQLLVKEEALQDMTEAFIWYEQERIGLGVEFLDELGKYYSRISTNPEHYQLHRNQRTAVMHRFPFKIVFEVEGENIIVYAVYHDKRNPEKLSERG
jgi:plasmid stabilization system protein ParE